MVNIATLPPKSLADVLGEFSDALALLECAHLAIETVRDREPDDDALPGLEAIGSQLLILGRAVKEIHAVYEAFDATISAMKL